MSDPTLDPVEEAVLDTLRHGAALDADPREWVGCLGRRRAAIRLVEKGLARLTRPVPWANHGMFVVSEKGER